jgi:tetratricopeptide (TPR) repeat protein
VPREYQGIVARALAKKPADRFDDCSAVAVELEKLGAPVSSVLGTQLGSLGETTWQTATGVMDKPLQETTWIDPQHSIAVLPFRNMSGNPDAEWMQSGLQVMLGSDLSQIPTLRVVPADRLTTLMADLKLGPGAALDETAVRSIGEFLNVDTIVSGSFVKLGPVARVDVSIRRPSTGEEVHEKAEAGTEAELLQVVAHLAAQVRRTIQSEGARDLVVTMVGEKGSKEPDAIRAYVDGLAKLYEGNNIEAITLLSEAVEHDSDFALAYTYLGEALSNSGRAEEARGALRNATQRGEGLTRADSLFITAREAMAAGEIERAIEAFELLVQLLPNNLSAVYELAQAYEMKGDWDGAIRNLERIIELDPKFVTALFAMGRVNIKKGSGHEALEPGALAQHTSGERRGAGDRPECNRSCRLLPRPIRRGPQAVPRVARDQATDRGPPGRERHAFEHGRRLSGQGRLREVCRDLRGRPRDQPGAGRRPGHGGEPD